MSSYDKYKDELSKLDRADWEQAEELVLTGDINSAINALLLIVPDAARSYAKAAAIFNVDFDDVIGVGNVALVEAVHSWQPAGESLKNWCYKKVGRDMGRFMGKELAYINHTEEELPDEHEDEPLDESMTGLDKVSQTQIREWVNANMSPRESEIVNLVYFRGMGIREIARKKGVSAEAISKIHRRALGILREEVDTLGIARDIL